MKKIAAFSMSEDIEYRCFIGNLSWSTSDRGLKGAFEKFGNLLEAKVMNQGTLFSWYLFSYSFFIFSILEFTDFHHCI